MMNNYKVFPENINFGLSLKITTLMLVGILVTTGLLFYYTEEIIEEINFSATKKQALIFLQGVERDIQNLPTPFNRQDVSDLLHNATKHDYSVYDFSIENIYIYNNNGDVTAFIKEPHTLSKDLTSYYGDVIRHGKAYLGAEIEWYENMDTEKLIPKTDVIVPLHYGSEIIGAIEVELDLHNTMRSVRTLSSQYKEKFLLILFISAVLILAFSWLIMHWRLISPIKQLDLVTKQIADGDLNVRSSIRSRDEIGNLGKSVNLMANSIKKLFQERDETYLGILQSLTGALEAKDNYTASHSEKVTEYALKLGKHIGLDEEELKTLEHLHDLGKIGIPDSILNKISDLNEKEYEAIKCHPEVTYNILSPLKEFKELSSIARSHHERWDGTGYPDQLSGEDIPLLARIVAIADTWDTLIGDRIYRKKVSVENVLLMFEKEKNWGQWDPKLLESFIEMIREESVSEYVR